MKLFFLVTTFSVNTGTSRITLLKSSKACYYFIEYDLIISADETQA